MLGNLRLLRLIFAFPTVGPFISLLVHCLIEVGILLARQVLGACRFLLVPPLVSSFRSLATAEIVNSFQSLATGHNLAQLHSLTA